jgi:hypothetical protein
MPSQNWTPTFSDALPDPQPITFFELLPQNFYIKAERAVRPHTGAAPIVTVSVSKVGNSDVDTNTLNEGDPPIYLSGNTCNGFCVASARQPGETVQVDVTVTWQANPFG